MPTSPLGMSFTVVDEAIQSPTLCPLHFLPLWRPQALWPGRAAGLGELQAGCHVLWSHQTAACSHRSVLHSLGKYILPLAPRLVCLHPKCLTQLSEKIAQMSVCGSSPLSLLRWATLRCILLNSSDVCGQLNDLPKEIHVISLDRYEC